MSLYVELQTLEVISWLYNQCLPISCVSTRNTVGEHSEEMNVSEAKHQTSHFTPCWRWICNINNFIKPLMPNQCQVFFMDDDIYHVNIRTTFGDQWLVVTTGDQSGTSTQVTTGAILVIHVTAYCANTHAARISTSVWANQVNHTRNILCNFSLVKAKQVKSGRKPGRTNEWPSVGRSSANKPSETCCDLSYTTPELTMIGKPHHRFPHTVIQLHVSNSWTFTTDADDANKACWFTTGVNHDNHHQHTSAFILSWWKQVPENYLLAC